MTTKLDGSTARRLLDGGGLFVLGQNSATVKLACDGKGNGKACGRYLEASAAEGVGAAVRLISAHAEAAGWRLLEGGSVLALCPECRPLPSKVNP